MNHKSSFLYRATRSLVSACGIKFASLLKTSYIFGSHAAFFSATSIAMPLMGAWNNVPTIMMTCVFGFLVRLVMGASFMPMLAYWVPGMCAALYWQMPSKIYRVGVPLLCMLLFIANPVGAAAAPYSFYWILPIIIAIMRFENIWSHALASTFTAHAVGSVIWLYTAPMSCAAWMALIPVVACERLLYAAGIVVGHSVIAAYLNRKRSLRLLTYETQSPVAVNQI